MNSNANCQKLSSRKLNTQLYVQRAKSVHGDKYDYSLVEYVRGDAKVKIICSVHGVFLQEAFFHLKGGGCRSCFYESRTKNTDSFVSRAKKIHGDKYDYSLVDYVNWKAKVKIKCPTHGFFLQAPVGHLQGRGCALCNNHADDLSSFTAKAKKVHGEKYDYSKGIYLNNKTPIEIICHQHGSFFQSPNAHLDGSGCRACATSGFNYQAPAILYLLKFQKDYATFWKIGITNRSIKDRYKLYSEHKAITEQKTWKFSTGWDAFRVEQDLIKTFAPYRMQFLFPLLENGGDSECFTLKLPVHKVKSLVDSLKTQGACLLSD